MIPQVKTPKLVEEFKAFAMRGNVIDLTVGVIIGASFGKVVTSVVTDILMPPISMLIGGVDFSNLFVTLSKGSYSTIDAAKAAGAVTLNYGLFLNVLVDFIIVAFTVFMLVKAMSKMRREPAPAEPDTRECPRCTSSIKKKATRCPACTADVQAVA